MVNIWLVLLPLTVKSVAPGPWIVIDPEESPVKFKGPLVSVIVPVTVKLMIATLGVGSLLTASNASPKLMTPSGQDLLKGLQYY